MTTRKIVFFSHTGYCGMDSVDFVEYPEGTTDDQLDQEAWMFALQNASSYGIYPMDEMPEDCSEEEEDNYSDNIEGYWEEYDAEKHDVYASNGLSPF
jgi:hypothetical protein